MPKSSISEPPAGSPLAAERSPRRRASYLFTSLFLAITSSVGAFYLGESVETSRGGALRITGHLQGAVSYVDLEGSAFCVTPPRREQRCSVPYLQPASARLTVGEQVSVATAELNERGRIREVFIVLARD